MPTVIYDDLDETYFKNLKPGSKFYFARPRPPIGLIESHPEMEGPYIKVDELYFWKPGNETKYEALAMERVIIW